MFWYIIIPAIVLFVIWLWWTSKPELKCPGCFKTYRRKGGYNKHLETCSAFANHKENIRKEQERRNEQQRKENEQKQKQKEEEQKRQQKQRNYQRKSNRKNRSNWFYDDYWEKLRDLQRRRDEATDHLWDEYFESNSDYHSERIFDKINDIDDMFDQEEDELWEKYHGPDNHSHEDYHREYEQKTRDGQWNRDKQYEKSWNSWEKAKQNYEKAKQDWKEKTGKDWNEDGDWWDNFEDFLEEESINIDECYETLGLPTNATFKEVKIRFRELALKHHPDRCTDKKAAEEKFKKINEAYETIKNSKKTETQA